MNPLLQDFNTPPFSKISNTDFEPAIKKGIEIAKEEINIIALNSDKATFDNTIVALDFSGKKLNRITSIFFNLNAAETDDELQRIAQEVSPLLSEFSNDITLNESLFKRVKAVFDDKKNLDLTPEQEMLLNKRYKSFARNGANLNETGKTELRKIDAQLSKLSLKFGENVLAETNAFEMHLTKEIEVAGLPESVKEAAHQLAKEKEKKGWIFTLDYPSYIPFLTYADSRELRKKMAIAAGKKAFQNNDFNNEKNVLDIVKLRYQRANLLGYKSHAHFVLEERMAETPEKVIAFSKDLLKKAKPAAEKEFTNLENYAKKLDGISQLQKWDGAYYSEKLKKEIFDLDQEILKPYFGEYFDVEEEDTYFSILPTATQYARNSLFAGLMPSEIRKRFPSKWVEEDEEGGKNNFEEDFLNDHLKRLGIGLKTSYTKITSNTKGKKLVDNFSDLLNNDFNVIVYNFVDMLSHARTDMEVIKELADDDSAYRSITESWFRHSPLLEVVKKIAESGCNIVLTTDHGMVKVDNPVKIVGDKSVNTNLRYKLGKNLSYNQKEVFEVKNPDDAFLPKINQNTRYVFCKDSTFFAYPNNYNYYVNFYKDTFQHGGISLEEVIIPIVRLKAKK